MKTLKSLIFCLIVILGVSSFAKAAPLSRAPSTLYVMEGGKGDCFSWTTACDLQTALLNAIPGDEVWVAKGTYIPTTPSGRFATFQLKTGVAIYGGFPAAGGEWAERDWVAHPTTLSGDIGTIGDNTDNSYHVVTSSGVDVTAVLDGFTISGGNANGSSPSPHGYGGGMYNDFNSSPTLTNVTFSGNMANFGGGMYNSSSSPTLTNITFSTNSATQGGGMFNYFSSPTLTNVTFSGNSANSGGGMYNNSSSPTLTNVTFSANPAQYGGGMYNTYSSSRPTLTNVTFSGNSAYFSGGGMYNDSSHPKLTNVTFSRNSANMYGGGMCNQSSNPTLTNAIVWGNTNDQIYNSSSTPIITYSDIEGWTSGGTGNINLDPKLGSLADNGGFTQTHALLSGSAAIDTANPAYCPTYDQRYFARPIDGDNNGTAICDMGAFEYWSTVNGFTLTVEKVGSGSVVIDPPKTGYHYGEVVTVTAAAGPGSTFTGWSGDSSGTDNPLTITIDRITTITATFTQNNYTLTVVVEPTGSGTVTRIPDQTIFHYGDEVTLTPIADLGWTFDNWSGATVTDNKLIITGNTTVTANFSQIDYTLTVMANPPQAGTVTRNPDQTIFHYGEEVTLTPSANPGWTFASWSGNATVTDNKVTITGDTSITANWE